MNSGPLHPINEPMKIGFRVGTFPKLSETFILDQIEGMIARGHQVSILANDRAKPQEKAVSPEGLHDLSYVRSDNPLLSGLQDRLPYRLRRALTASRERKFCTANDVIICNFGWFGAQVLESANSLSPAPKILTIFHGDDMSRSLLANGGNLYSDLFDQRQMLLPVSDFWSERLQQFGAREEDIFVHRMGVKTENFKYAPKTRSNTDPFKLVTVCRFVEKKGLEYAIRGFAKAVSQAPDLTMRFELIGSGPLEASLKALVRDLGISELVSFSGALPHKEVAHALARSDALVLPSVVSEDGDMEGIPLSLMEAMASGVGVISTYHSGIPELIENGVSGLLAQEKNCDQIADHILTLARNPELAVTLTRNAREVIEEKFNSTKLNDQLEELCKRALTDSGVAPQSTE